METSRRTFLGLTAAGLIHLSTNPLACAAGQNGVNTLIRRAAERGHTDLGWLKSYHSFSFGKYYDQRHMGFRSLRVINDDKISAGRGFPTHPHRDMEIISYVVEGALQHRDSTGNGSIIKPGDIQRMSAGTGITHSEYNPSPNQSNHFLQIWIEPAQRGLRPSYGQKAIQPVTLQNNLVLIAGNQPGTSNVIINQDAKLFAGKLGSGEHLSYNIERNRHGWLQVARGNLTVNGTQLAAGDSIVTSKPTQLVLNQAEAAEFLLFDLG